MNDVNVVIMDNPFGIKGSVHKNSDGSYTIIINGHLNWEQQLDVYMHEVNHINSGDFEKESAQSIEFDVHNTKDRGKF